MALSDALYVPLDVSKTQVRVVDLVPSGSYTSPIVCRLRHVSLEDKPSYDALSWCWGIDPPTGTLMVNEQTMQCSPNLESALRRFRQPAEHITLWVDAVSINQTDLQEKTSQIPLMGRIYSQAQTVRAWLGESTDDSDEAVGVMKQLQQVRSFGRLEFDGQPVTVYQLQSFVNPLKRPWWTRMWVVQEVFLARQAVLYCGRSAFDFTDFHHVIKDIATEKAARITSRFRGAMLPEMDGDRLALEDALFEALRDALGPFGYVTGAMESPQRAPLDTLKIMIALGQLKATDLRDKVFGCIGMLPELKNIMCYVDYECPVTQVYAITTFYLMGHLQTLHPLCYFQSATKPGLPSWSLRFDAGAECHEDLPRLFRAFSATCWNDWEHPRLQVSPDALRLSVSGSFLDEIVSCHPTQPDWAAFFDTFNEAMQDSDLCGTVGFELMFTNYMFCHWTWRTFFGLDRDGHSHTAYIGGGSLEDAYWRTVAFNQRHVDGTKAIKQLGKDDIKSYLRFLRHDIYLENQTGAAEDIGVSVHQRRALAEQYKLGVLSATARDLDPIIRGAPHYGTSLFRTSRGYFGLALHKVSPGDQIHILDRATLPMVLRTQQGESGQTVFEVVSACYTHGVMHGEAFEPQPDVGSKQWQRHGLRRQIFGGEALDPRLPLKRWDWITLT